MIKDFSVREALVYGFSTTVQNFLLFLTAFLGSILTLFFAGLVFGWLQGTSILSLNYLLKMHQLQDLYVLLGLTSPISIVGLSILTHFLSLGFTRLALILHDNGLPTVSQFFSIPWTVVIRTYIAAGLYWLIVVCGMILFIIPGIIWALRFGLYRLVLVDKDIGVIEALKVSYRSVFGATWSLLRFECCALVLNWTALMTAGLGYLFIFPMLLLARVYIYRKLLGVAPINHIPPSSAIT